MGTSRSYDHRHDLNSAIATHHEQRELKHYGLKELQRNSNCKELSRNKNNQIPAETSENSREE